MAGRAKRCTKCIHFRRSKRKITMIGEAIHMEANSWIEGIADYYCLHRWWNTSNGRKSFAENDVCEDFEFRTKKNKP